MPYKLRADPCHTHTCPGMTHYLTLWCKNEHHSKDSVKKNIKGIAPFICSFPNYELNEMGPWVMLPPSTARIPGILLACEIFSTVGSPPLTHKATAAQISIFQWVHTLIVRLSCWDGVMTCFIWHTSCYVMTSVVPIISLPLLWSYLYVLLPPNKGLSLFCENHIWVVS